MIEISFWKILVVLIVALIVLGPKRLPKLARSAGQFLSQLRVLVNSLQKEMTKPIEEEKPTASVEDKKEDNPKGE